MQWRQLDHMQTTCTSLQADNHTSTSPLNFYWSDALPDAQPTVSTALKAGKLLGLSIHGPRPGRETIRLRHGTD